MGNSVDTDGEAADDAPALGGKGFRQAPRRLDAPGRWLPRADNSGRLHSLRVQVPPVVQNGGRIRDFAESLRKLSVEPSNDADPERGAVADDRLSLRSCVRPALCSPLLVEAGLGKAYCPSWAYPRQPKKS